MWAVAALLLLLSCQCYQAGTKGVVSKLESDYVGCYYDDGNRLLKHRGKALQDNSIENCRKHCEGFKYIGLQFRKWCFCGNTLDLKHYPKKPEKDCHMPCTGNTRQICGGGWRNSIYYQKAEKDDYVGCYLDDGHRLLKHRGKVLKDNSIESCRKHCTGFKFIGLQYSHECFCGNTLDPIHYPKRPEKDCKMPCTGNTQQMCGGSWRNSIYYQKEKDDYVGCYLDDGHRLLKHRGKVLKDNSIESCRKHCTGFKFIGLQYSHECFCGNTLDPIHYPKRPEKDCKMPCTGNTQQMCGGSWRNSIYYQKEKDDYVGCYLDDGHRLLKHRGKVLKDNSIESCRKHCTGFKFIGLQYSHECFCGNTLDPIHYPKRPEKDCKMPCTGNTQQMCGGSWRNSIYYQNVDYVGCYLDDGKRLLKHRGKKLQDNSLESCRKHCKGFKYLGLQYRDECYCGDTLDPEKYPLKPERECQMPCKGNRRQKCGGTWRISIYHV